MLMILEYHQRLRLWDDTVEGIVTWYIRSLLIYQVLFLFLLMHRLCILDASAFEFMPRRPFRLRAIQWCPEPW